MSEHETHLTAAIEQARKGADLGEQPFGAVVVYDGAIIGSAYSRKMGEPDITAHAEIRALRSATTALGRRQLAGCVLYTTCEPCPMCAGAALNADIEQIVFGAHISDLPAPEGHHITFKDYSLRSFAQLTGWNLRITAGLLAETCVALYQEPSVPITR